MTGSTPWRPEREVSLDEARRRVRECGLAGDDVRIIASGWDNTVVLADETWVFRFPRREIALPGIEREIALLPGLAPRLSLPIPVPEHVGMYGDPPWRFWGGRHLPGTELAVSPNADHVAVATAIGRFLAELHALPIDASLPVDPFGRADAASRAARARDVIAELRGLDLLAEDAAIVAVLAEGEAAGPARAAPVFSHGDLYARHVLVDDAGDASAIIDWGDVCAAPPSVDLSIAFSAFTGSARQAMLDAYGSIDSDTELRARVMAIFSAASVTHYAHDIGDPALLSGALAGLTGTAL